MGTLSSVPAVFRSGSFNGDGRQDLLVRNARTGELFVLPHRGEFKGPDTYGDPVLIGTGFGLHLWLCAGDLTGDGTADLVCITNDDRTLVFLNQGGLDGPRTLGEPIHVGGKPPERTYDTIALGDLTGNGIVDIIGRVQGTGEIHRILHQGKVDGPHTFAPPADFALIDPTDLPVGLADITVNGEPDLLVRRVDGTLVVHEVYAGGKGEDARPLAPAGFHPLGTGWDKALVIDITDIDGDGRPDLLALYADGSLVVHRHSGTFDPADPGATFLPPVALGTGWADFDIVS
ncbi:VCBS repeat-containing protein [Streptomyces sp. A012304]|uniref:FG-GAP repeat domain-containing protein n=1 Tax=Streptomyces sp. A012304 TaxID=375446 RepID=UPI00223099DD|nr:VCBS repeat-containing protein [Streptomyces sp. A012304]